MFKQTLVLIYTFTFSASVIAVNTEKNGCENAPKNAVLNLGAPYDSWFKVECNAIRKAHFITAQKGYKWREKNTGKSYSFNAFGPISPRFNAIQKNIYEPHKYYFLKYKSTTMRANELAGTNKLLPNRKKDYKIIHQLDVVTTTRTIYNFFIFVEKNTPEWIVACVNYKCRQSATIQVIK